MQLTLAAACPCPGQGPGGPPKLWHDVWQILQEIPAGLFNFLWTATKVLSHIIVAGNGLLVVWGGWVCISANWVLVHPRPYITRATRAMTGPGPLIDNYDVGLESPVASLWDVTRCHWMSHDLWWRWQLRRWAGEAHEDTQSGISISVIRRELSLSTHLTPRRVMSYVLEILESNCN